MGRTVICLKCKSTFDESVLENRDNPNICPVCGASLSGSGEEDHSDWITWYYYGCKNGTARFLEETPIDLGERYYLIKEFQAPPKDKDGNCDAAKAELRKYVPDAFAETKRSFYYYKEGGGMLDDTLSSKFTPLYKFEAVDLEDAKRQLKEILPNSPLFKSIPKVQCPYCFSTQVQMVPKKFSLLTGILTNGYNRVCVRCQRKF